MTKRKKSAKPLKTIKDYLAERQGKPYEGVMYTLTIQVEAHRGLSPDEVEREVMDRLDNYGYGHGSSLLNAHCRDVRSDDA